MKRFALACGLLAAILLLATVGIRTVENACREMNNLLEQAAADPSPETAALVENRWVELEPRLGYFLDNSTVESIGEAITRLEPFILAGDVAAFQGECRWAQVKLLHVAEDTKPDFSNVF